MDDDDLSDGLGVYHTGSEDTRLNNTQDELAVCTGPLSRVNIVDFTCWCADDDYHQGESAKVAVEAGIWTEVPGTWPETVEYRYLRGGFAGWVEDVTTVAEPAGTTLAERERVERQSQISAYFTGAAVQSSSVAAPPPVMPMGGGAKKKKAGGC